MGYSNTCAQPGRNTGHPCSQGAGTETSGPLPYNEEEPTCFTGWYGCTTQALSLCLLGLMSVDSDGRNFRTTTLWSASTSLAALVIPEASCLSVT